MNKIILILIMIFMGITSQQSQAFSLTDGNAEITVHTEYTNQVNPELNNLLLPLLENMGVEVEELIIMDLEIAKSCTIRIKGTIDGKEVDVTITIEGKSCAELIKQL